MEKDLKILILEDVAFDAELIEYELRREGLGFLSKRVETEEDFITQLNELKPDLILADNSLPSFDGLSALEIANKECPYTPFLFVSGKIGEEFAVNALKKGATDYIFKNNLSKLVPAIQRALKEYNEQIEREKAEDALRRAYADLEQQVHERTAELSQVNEGLIAEMDERKQIENKLKISLEEKEILLREIHHRVKNNLQIISSLLNLQSIYIANDEMLEIYKESQNRVKSMAMIHEKLYQSEDLAKIDFGDYVKSLILNLFSSYGVNESLIKLEININDILLDINTAVPCGLIINELVTNSIKHGFPDIYSQKELNRLVTGPDEKESKINIDINKNDEIYTMNVYDNGIGFPQNLDFKKTESLGMQLVISLIDQLRGTVELKREDGTFFEIVFKELKYKKEF
ncbi:MAG: response regulator [Methanobacterium sp.]|uniref:sensor histidine kinase n=1 Tax=Methanobacterium sp. TaxID=2164 RepID=UPI003D64C836|nr:response regulator [Methanobacterium sp.]